MKRFIIVLILIVPSWSYSQDTTAIHKFLDDWHMAAAQADAEVYFGSIADNGTYIGTDASERWDKESFWKFSKPHFEKGKAWDFRPHDRKVVISDNSQVAWFSELLDTWMGICRGSGVLIKTDGGWKISQYVLSVTVANDDMNDFIKLMNK